MRSDEAASPIIATILLVGMAVVFAGLVFLISTLLSRDDNTPAPAVGLIQDEGDDELYVAMGATGAQWSYVEVRSSDPVRVALNGAASLSSQALPAGGYHALAGASGEFMGGDFLSFCGDGGLQTHVQITVRYVVPNKGATILQEPEYELLLPCV